MLLKTGQFDRIEELKLAHNIESAFIQFFKYHSLAVDVEIPRVADVFLKDIQDIMKGRTGDSRLIEDNVDFAWRSLTLLAKHP